MNTMLTLNPVAQASNLALFDDVASQPEAFTVAGVAVRQDAQGRFCLNDLHKAAGNEKRHQPSGWQEAQQTQDLERLLIPENPGIKPIESNAGRYGGTYVCKELVYAYAMWVSASFHLQVIRAYDGMAQTKRTQTEPPKTTGTPLAQDLEALQVLARWLNVAPSGQIGMARVAIQHHAPHLLPALPGYAVDAPAKPGVAISGSSEPTFSATHLLKAHSIKVSANKFNLTLFTNRLLERRTRPAKGSVLPHRFWAITDKGLAFGKNMVSDKNPRETQPHWYESTFGELLEFVGVKA